MINYEKLNRYDFLYLDFYNNHRQLVNVSDHLTSCCVIISVHYLLIYYLLI